MAKANPNLPDDFSNIVRLFPLPNVVLFPGLVQTLHIFEPRYRTLMADALATDHLIAVALLQPAPAFQAIEPIFPTLCIGKVLTYHLLDDGRYFLKLGGVCRARVVAEVETVHPYRVARVEVPEEYSVGFAGHYGKLRDQVLSAFRKYLETQPPSMNESAQNWIDENLSLSAICDFIVYACQPNPVEQQKFLDEFNVTKRAGKVLEMLQSPEKQMKATPVVFPPRFSDN